MPEIMWPSREATCGAMSPHVGLKPGGSRVRAVSDPARLPPPPGRETAHHCPDDHDRTPPPHTLRQMSPPRASTAARLDSRPSAHTWERRRRQGQRPPSALPRSAATPPLQGHAARASSSFSLRHMVGYCLDLLSRIRL
jgi:hypothetical protein